MVLLLSFPQARLHPELMEPIAIAQQLVDTLERAIKVCFGWSILHNENVVPLCYAKTFSSAI